MTIQGKQTALPVTDPKDQAAAFAAFQKLLESVKATPAARPEPIAVLTAEYLDSISHRIAPQTRKDYATLLRRLVARFPKAAPADLEPCIVERTAMNEGWSDSHRANFLMVVQAFLRWCGCKDFRLRVPAKESRGDAVITHELYDRILRECTGDFYSLVQVLWLTGARPMEIVGLTAEGIDWATGTATLKQHKMKHKGKRRLLHFSTHALTILRRQADHYGSGLLFRGQAGRPFSRQAVIVRFLRLSAKLGVRIRAYSFRHSWATRALAKGIPDTHVAALLGHSSTNMLHKHYAHIHQDARLLREVAERAAG